MTPNANKSLPRSQSSRRGLAERLSLISIFDTEFATLLRSLNPKRLHLSHLVRATSGSCRMLAHLYGPAVRCKSDMTARPFLHLLHPTRKPRRELQSPDRWR